MREIGWTMVLKQVLESTREPMEVVMHSKGKGELGMSYGAMVMLDTTRDNICGNNEAGEKPGSVCEGGRLVLGCMRVIVEDVHQDSSK